MTINVYDFFRIAFITLFVCIPCLAQSTDVKDSDERAGVLVVSGSNEPGVEAIRRFCRLVPTNGRLVVVASPDQEQTVRHFAEVFSDSRVAELRVLKNLSAIDRVDESFDCVWITQLPSQEEREAWHLERIVKMVTRGMSVGISRIVAEQLFVTTPKRKSLMDTLSTDELSSPQRVKLIFGGSSDGIVPSVNDERLPVRLHDQSQLLMSARLIWSAGQPATIHLPQSDYWEDSESEINSSPRDLVALQRALRDRLYRKRQQAAPRIVEEGTLVLVGGGRIPPEMMTRFVKLAGGKSGHIVVLPTAVPDPIPQRHWIVDALKKAGASRVTVLTEREHSAVEREGYLETLEDATAVWLGGGRQWRFVDAYEGTKALEAMWDVLRRGGVIGGSSAGASIQAEYLARGNPLGNWNIMAEGYEHGFAFLPGTAVDQHFSQRNRLSELRSLIAKHPTYLGIGLDEGTGIVVTKNVAEVMGRGAAYFVSASLNQSDSENERGGDPEGRADESPCFVRLESGESIDLGQLTKINGE